MPVAEWQPLNAAYGVRIAWPEMMGLAELLQHLRLRGPRRAAVVKTLPQVFFFMCGSSVDRLHSTPCGISKFDVLEEFVWNFRFHRPVWPDSRLPAEAH